MRVSFRMALKAVIYDTYLIVAMILNIIIFLKD